MVTTPKVKLTWLDLRTKQCCHEHASEIFTIYPATCEPLGIFATGNEYNNLKVHFRVKGSELRTAPRFPGQLPVMTECGKGLTRDLSSNGIYFETDGPLASAQSIEFSIFLEHLYPDRPVCIKCKGSIVRVEKSGQRIGVATTIDSYSIEDHLYNSSREILQD